MADATVIAKPSLVEIGFALFVICAATGLLFIGRLDAASWVSTTTWTTAVYFLKQPAGVFATGWTAQALVKANTVAAVTKGLGREA